MYALIRCCRPSWQATSPITAIASIFADNMAPMYDAQAVARCAADFSDRRVPVLGDAILDEYLLGECTRISPEAPVPVLRVTRARHVLGGAANTAANIVSLGGHATLIALVGDDEGGRMLRQCAKDAGVNLLAVQRWHAHRSARPV